MNDDCMSIGTFSNYSDMFQYAQTTVLPGNQTLCVLDTTFIGQDMVMDNVQVNSLDIVYDRVVRQSSVK